MLPLAGDRKPFPFLQTPLNEANGKFSPDGQWMAYMSDETGGADIYVRPFGQGSAAGSQEAAGKWRISGEGAGQACWRADGKELFYLTLDGKLMAVDVKAGTSKGRPTLAAGVPKLLFDARAQRFFPFAVTTDGQRFLINTAIAEEKPQTLTVVVNWAAGLKR